MNQITEAVQKAISLSGRSIPQFAADIEMTPQQLYGIMGKTKRQNSPSIRTLGRVLDGAGLVLVAVDRDTGALLGGHDEL